MNEIFKLPLGSSDLSPIGDKFTCSICKTIHLKENWNDQSILYVDDRLIIMNMCLNCKRRGCKKCMNVCYECCDQYEAYTPKALCKDCSWHLQISFKKVCECGWISCDRHISEGCG